MKNKIDLSKQVIMLSGVSGSLGQKIANEILLGGGKVIGLDQSKENMEKVAKTYNWNKDNILLHETDIRSKHEIEKAFSDGLSRFGKVTAQINNAGVSIFSPWMEREEKDFDWVTDVNLKGTFFCMQIFMKYCIKSKNSGSIVNIASHYAVVAPDPRIYSSDPSRKNSEIYGATKAGVVQMTKYFSVNALHDGANVRVNSVTPGGIRNYLNPQSENFQKSYAKICPMGRLAEADEIVGPILFLISDDASYVNGHNLIVDGGATVW